MVTGKVGVIILNWNRPKDTLECLDSLLPNVRQGIASIICCDNGSTDDSVRIILDWARRYFTSLELADRHVSSAKVGSQVTNPSFVLIETGANLGYAGGNNAGLRYILECGLFDYIWILNNDTVIEPNALPALLAMAADLPQVAALGSTIIDYHHPEKIQFAGGCRYFPAITMMRPVLAGKRLSAVLRHTPEVRLDYVAGAAMLIRTTAIRDVGLLNESYFLYYEEVDYAKRLRCKGYRIGWCKDSIIRHKGGVSTGSLSEQNPRSSWTANYYENLSTLKYTAEHYPLLLLFAAVSRLLMKLAVSIVFWRWHSFPPLLQAYRDFFFRSGQQQVAKTPSPDRPHILFMGL